MYESFEVNLTATVGIDVDFHSTVSYVRLKYIYIKTGKENRFRSKKESCMFNGRYVVHESRSQQFDIRVLRIKNVFNNHPSVFPPPLLFPLRDTYPNFFQHFENTHFIDLMKLNLTKAKLVNPNDFSNTLRTFSRSYFPKMV